MIRAFVDSARRETAFLRGSVWDLALVTWLPLLLLAIVAVQLSAGVMRNLPIVVVDEDGGSHQPIGAETGGFETDVSGALDI